MQSIEASQMGPLPMQQPSYVILNLQIEIEGSDEKTLIKNQRANFDERGNLFLAPLLQQIKQSGFD